jgi:hypothetical protein
LDWNISIENRCPCLAQKKIVSFLFRFIINHNFVQEIQCLFFYLFRRKSISIFFAIQLFLTNGPSGLSGQIKILKKNLANKAKNQKSRFSVCSTFGIKIRTTFREQLKNVFKKLFYWFCFHWLNHYNVITFFRLFDFKKYFKIEFKLRNSFWIQLEQVINKW